MTFILQTKEQFLQYRIAFRQFAHARMATTEDHILYNMLRGRDSKHGFTPVKNERKLLSYMNDPLRAHVLALSSMKYNIKSRKNMKEWYIKYGAINGSTMPFCLKYGDSVTEEMWQLIEGAIK